MHTATLVHDDIVDDAQLRRSRFSINTVWKNKIAVLTGDYFLAKGLSFAISQKDYDILGLTSEVVQRIVEGELIQIEKTKKLDLNIEEYNNIIRLKTGSLFECAFKAGAISSNANDQQLHVLSEIGQLIGLMFQIKDDVLELEFLISFNLSNFSITSKLVKFNLFFLFLIFCKIFGMF